MTLLDALGAAKEGAWDLTADVYEHLGYRVKRSLVGRDGGRTWAFLNPSSSRWEAMQHFTTSIDAALQMVPEGAYWGVGTDIEAGVTAVVTKYKLAREDPDFDWKWEFHEHATAKTPALALCIAALKAREALRARAAHDSTEEK